MQSRVLAEAFLADGPWTVEGLCERGAAVLGRWPARLELLAMRVAAVHRVAPGHPYGLAELIDAFGVDLGAEAGEPAAADRVRVRARVFSPDWAVAPIESIPALAEMLELSLGQLDWLADVRGWERGAPDERLRNYRYRVLARAGGLPRVLEIPKARLKEIQRWILHEILDAIPAHPAAHAFVPGRSVVTNAAGHTSRRYVLTLDLRDFFATVGAGRVRGIFATAGYRTEVARTLAGLCTNTLAQAVWRETVLPRCPDLVGPRFWLGRRLATPHLPQGAPTSPALANLACFGLDRRLAGLARAAGATYSRYADDLTFSGDRPVRSLERAVAAIVGEEGFVLHPDKSRLRGAGGRQTVCGVVVNRRPNVRRRDFDRLKAELHRLSRDGGGDDETRARLRGQIAWVASLHPTRGARLLERFDAIDWGAHS